jgi:hypothetical protein
MLPVFLDCPFLVATSVFSNVYMVPYSSQTQHRQGKHTNNGYKCTSEQTVCINNK